MSELNPSVVYYNSRVRGRKSALFDRARLEALLDADISKMEESLLDSPYREEMAEAQARYHGADAIEDAVSRNLVHTFQRLIKSATGDFKDAVSVFLMRWDLLAIKSLLRCQIHGIRGEGAKPWLVPGPTLTLPVMLEMAEAESMDDLVNSLFAWNRTLCKPLLKTLPAYKEHDDLALLEEALDIAYFSENAKVLSKKSDEFSRELADLLKGEIDRINLRVVFQVIVLKGDKDQAHGRMLPEGHLPLRLLKAMLESDNPEAAIEKLNGTRYQSVAPQLLEFVKAGEFAAIERFFENNIVRQIRRIARQNVFGLGVMMDFVWLKYNEVVNLRLIARALSGHLPKARVRDELVFV